MLTWMQKHKKYLVVTIWISTIAFVGAGFVGWGAYDLNSNRATSVAKVGNRNITIQEFQKTYSNLYNYYSSLSEGKFTQEQADEMGLDRIALQRLIQENLFLNYADDIGLMVSKEELIAALTSDEGFQVDGKFDKSRYEDTLKRARITPKDFENELTNKLLLNKFFDAINLKTNQTDLDILASSYFMEDKVSINIIKVDKNSILVDENELKDLWEKSKNRYLTKSKFELQTQFIPQTNIDVNDTVLEEFFEENRGNYRDGFDKLLTFDKAKDDVKYDYELKQARKTALEEYLKIKKRESNATTAVTVLEDNEDFPINELRDAKVGDVLKPFEYKNGYMIAELVGKNMPEVMSYEEAKDALTKVYMDEKGKKLLEEKAKQSLNNFSGKDIGFVSRDTKKSIDGLSETEYLTFIMKLFESPNKNGYVMLDTKAVVYSILEQRLLNLDKVKEYNALLSQNASAIKNGQLERDLLDALQKRYKIEQYYKR
ncbi:peptidylprolyl isomerase [Campylobacter fetus]|uniref:peptidylprolyl isomerase n=1 Tax=Campylobacter fetus TaxID=196 RepID=UPI000FC9A14A|nr:peptidylprolyl isomerase [Campylobacter fetus]QQF51422.1 peptidylprolyl isomerase [Campylobacter fetus subsp. venerealis]RUT49075.1 peptidylprolyl isomerase [Campylobacter fetus]RUT49239.1 peptidylprolyl isomerase [Campylobacter fetus]